MSGAAARAELLAVCDQSAECVLSVIGHRPVIGLSGVRVLETQMHERDAFRAIFSFADHSQT